MLTKKFDTKLDNEKKLIKEYKSNDVSNKESLTQDYINYTDKDEDVFEKILTQSSKKENLKNYTESDLEAFNNIFTNNKTAKNINNSLSKKISGKIYEKS